VITKHRVGPQQRRSGARMTPDERIALRRAVVRLGGWQPAATAWASSPGTLQDLESGGLVRSDVVARIRAILETKMEVA
jgi:hypothetical protein